ncbi:hypothetical protein THIOSC13_550003 [uncultured Thiomicrorhabdus sp.]
MNKAVMTRGRSRREAALSKLAPIPYKRKSVQFIEKQSANAGHPIADGHENAQLRA